MRTLYGPPLQKKISYPSEFTADETQDPSSRTLPDMPPTTMVTPMDMNETSSEPNSSVPASPPQTVAQTPVTTLSPVRNFVPPNAPLVPFAVPPIQTNDHSGDGTQQRRTPPVSAPGVSQFYSSKGTRCWWVPRSDIIIASLEALAYISKYPKFRAFFNSTRFIPSLLDRWATPEDAKKDVNVFELVERFTVKAHHPTDVHFWASIVMRHYSRRDNVITKRQCSNLQCRQWESDDQRFKSCPKCKCVPLMEYAYIQSCTFLFSTLLRSCNARPQSLVHSTSLHG